MQKPTEKCNNKNKNLAGWSQYQRGDDRIESVNLRTDQKNLSS